MKKLLTKTIAFLMVAMTCGTMVACGGNNSDPMDSLYNEEIDENRTQIFVNNYNGGYGSEWLIKVKQRYEALHANDVYEEGKQGIQVMINPHKQAIGFASGTVLAGRDEVYFSEFGYYYSLKNAGLLGDITEAVTTPLTEYGETDSIVDKLTTQQQDFLAIDENGSDHYYALPHYQSFFGITYNVDLFDSEGYYFIEQPTGTELEDYFIYNDDDVKSAGPDGEKGTDDDGLPATYEEFFMLCEFIYRITGNTPIIWNGANNMDYLNNFLYAMLADYEGLEQMKLGFSFNGLATDLGTVDVNGNFVEDTNDTLITEATGYETYRQAGRYYALNFLYRLIKSDYHNDLAFNGGYSHMDAQDDFLNAGHDGTTKPIAMLIEGIWWENEADQTFKEMADSKGEAYSRTSRRFALMPLPKASVAKAGKATLFDSIYSICFMKANVEEWKKPICYDFIRFCHSNESLVEFTTTTNCPKAFEYTLEESDLAKMSYFGKSVMKLKERSDVVYPISKTGKFVNNQSMFAFANAWKTSVTSGTLSFPSTAFNENKATVKEYFEGMYRIHKSGW